MGACSWPSVSSVQAQAIDGHRSPLAYTTFLTVNPHRPRWCLQKLHVALFPPTHTSSPHTHLLHRPHLPSCNSRHARAPTRTHTQCLLTHLRRHAHSYAHSSILDSLTHTHITTLAHTHTHTHRRTHTHTHTNIRTHHSQQCASTPGADEDRLDSIDDCSSAGTFIAQRGDDIQVHAIRWWCRSVDPFPSVVGSHLL